MIDFIQGMEDHSLKKSCSFPSLQIKLETLNQINQLNKNCQYDSYGDDRTSSVMIHSLIQVDKDDFGLIEDRQRQTNINESNQNELKSLLSPRLNVRKIVLDTEDQFKRTSTTDFQTASIKTDSIFLNKSEPDEIRKKFNETLKDPVRVIKITEIIEINDNSFEEEIDQDMSNNDLPNFLYDSKCSYQRSKSEDEASIRAFSDIEDYFEKKIISHKNQQIYETFNKNVYTTTRTPVKSTRFIQSPDFKQVPIIIEKPIQTNDIINNTNSPSRKNQIILEIVKSPKIKIDDKNNANVQSGPSVQMIPVVHNFSFTTHDDPLSNKPKKVTIKITGRTRSNSSDTRKLIEPNIAMQNLNENSTPNESPISEKHLDSEKTEKFKFSPINTKLNSGSPRPTLNNYFKDNEELRQTILKKLSINNEATRKKENLLEKNIEPDLLPRQKFDLDKFKSYLNNFNESPSHSNNVSPLKSNIINDSNNNHTKNIYNTSDPFRPTELSSILKNAGEIIGTKSAFTSIKSNTNINESTQIWTHRSKKNEEIDDFSENSSTFDYCNKKINSGLISKQNLNNFSKFENPTMQIDNKNFRYPLTTKSISLGNKSAFTTLTRFSKVNDETKSNWPNSPTRKDLKLDNRLSAKTLTKLDEYVNNDEKTLSLPLRHNKAKNVNTYYNNYYRDILMKNVNNYNKRFYNSMANEKFIDQDDGESDEINDYKDEEVRLISFELNPNSCFKF